MSIEEKTSATILEKENEIVIDGKKYLIAPPTTATLIMASEMISKLPKKEITETMNAETVLFETLRFAKDVDIIGDILAILVMGAKKIKQSKTRFWLRIKYNRLRLAILNSDPKKLDEILGICLQRMQINDFFLVIGFLNKINLTKATK